MVTPEYTLILTPSGSKMALPPRKPPQHKNKSLFPQTVIFQKLKYIYIINVYVYIVRPTRMRSSIPLLEPGPPRFFWWYENSE